MEATNNIQTMPSPTKPNQSLPKTAVERLAGGASVSRAFGEPIAVQGRTIIPVAMVAMGFRGGFWGRVQGLFGNSAAEPHPANGATNGASNAAGEEQARGGIMRRMVVRPVGFIDVTNGDSRFVTIAPGRFVALGVALAFVAGGLMARQRRKMLHKG
ncbi:MAG: hypothetical protein H7Z21_11995 [Hymenobacter sp.]|nr:hypothetical protein [Hymenobacter sp.]